jgi:hypothetical protein
MEAGWSDRRAERRAAPAFHSMQTDPTPDKFGLVVGFLCCKNGTKFPLMSRWQMTTAMIYGYGFHI